MKATAAILVFLIGAAVDAQPAEAMRLAHADAAKLPASVRPYLLYLSMHNLTEKERSQFRPVLWGHCNQLSRSPLLTRPASVGASMLRVNLKDYGWTRETRDRMRDPYFTVTEEKDREWGYYRGSEWVRTKFVREKYTAFAPWLVESPEDRARITEFYHWTGDSYAAVVRADWFFNQTAAAVDREVSYYDFLGIKDEATFNKMVGFDPKLAKGFRFELREAVAMSGVTLQPRAIVRWDTLGGGRWATLDFKQAKGERNPLNVFGRDIEKEYDASEVYAALPNGLWAVAAFNRKGEIQRAVPGDIANDHASKSNDKQITPGISCFRCHEPGGLQAIDGWARTILNPPLELRVYDEDKARELRENYLRDLKTFMDRDTAQYIAAIKAATGLEAKEWRTRQTAFYERYENAKVDAAWAANDLGITEAELRRKLLVAIKGGYPVSPVAGSFAHEGLKVRAIGIRQYEEVIEELYRIVQTTK